MLFCVREGSTYVFRNAKDMPEWAYRVTLSLFPQDDIAALKRSTHALIDTTSKTVLYFGCERACRETLARVMTSDPDIILVRARAAANLSA